jgi:hypothetical protein
MEGKAGSRQATHIRIILWSVILEETWYNSSMNDNQAQHKITLSIPRETWEAVNELARAHQRSFTKELVWALQEYVRREHRRKRESEP